MKLKLHDWEVFPRCHSQELRPLGPDPQGQVLKETCLEGLLTRRWQKDADTMGKAPGQ